MPSTGRKAVSAPAIRRRSPGPAPGFSLLTTLAVAGIALGSPADAAATRPSSSSSSPPTSRQSGSPPARAALSGGHLRRLARVLGGSTRSTFARASNRGGAAADTCEATRSALECECASVRTDDGLRWRARSVRWREDERRWRGLVVTFEEGARVEAESARSHDRRLRIEELRIVPARESDVLRADRAEWRRAGPIELKAITWHARDDDAGDVPADCPPDPVRPPVPGTVHASAGRARQTEPGASWRLHGVRLPAGPVAVPIGADGAIGDRPADGILPPSVATDGEVLEARASYLFGSVLAGPLAVVAPGDWYGVGLRTASPRAPHSGAETGPSHPTLLDTDVRWSPGADRSVDAVAEGSFFRGTGDVHLAADLEETTHTDAWRLERHRGDRLFRRWRRSRAGVALSGEAHTLSARFDHLGPASSGASELDDYTGELRIAADTELAPGLAGAARISHVSSVREFSADDHRSLAWVQLETTVGERDRLFAEFEVGNYLTSRLEPGATGDGGEPVGFDPRTGAQSLIRTMTGATWTGRWSTGTHHRVAPKVVAVREIAGVSATPTSRATASPERTPQWTAAGLILDQSFSGEQTRVRTPTGMMVESGGFDGPVEATVWSRIAVSPSPAMSIESSAAADRGGLRELAAELEISHSPWELTLGGGASTDRGAAIVRSDRRFGDVWTAATRGQDAFRRPRAPLAAFERVDVRVATEDWTLRTAGYAAGRLDRVGATIDWRIPVERTGWSLGIGAAYASRNSRLAARAGLVPGDRARE